MVSVSAVARLTLVLSGLLLAIYVLNLLIVAGFLPVSVTYTLDGPQQFVLLLIMSGLFTFNILILQEAVGSGTTADD